MDNDMRLLVEVTEQYLASASVDKALDVDLDESMYQRCEVARQNLRQILLKSASNRKYGHVAVLPLFALDFTEPELFKRPYNTYVGSEFFQLFVCDLADKGFRCFIDRPGLTSSLLSNFFGLMPDMKLRHYKMQELKEQHKVEWTLYVSMPGCKPPRQFWMRNLAYHIRGLVLLIVGITFYAWTGYMLFWTNDPDHIVGMLFLLVLAIHLTGVYLDIKFDLGLYDSFLLG